MKIAIVQHLIKRRQLFLTVKSVDPVSPIKKSPRKKYNKELKTQATATFSDYEVCWRSLPRCYDITSSQPVHTQLQIVFYFFLFFLPCCKKNSVFVELSTACRLLRSFDLMLHLTFWQSSANPSLTTVISFFANLFFSFLCKSYQTFSSLVPAQACF